MTTLEAEHEVRRHVNRMNGVDLIAVDLVRQTVIIDYNPDRASPAAIAAYLATSGFPVAPLGPA